MLWSDRRFKLGGGGRGGYNVLTRFGVRACHTPTKIPLFDAFSLRCTLLNDGKDGQRNRRECNSKVFSLACLRLA